MPDAHVAVTTPTADDLARCLDEIADLGDLATPPFALAVSGGSDSLALLWLAARAFPGRCAALSVDHGLRPESAGECALVARHAAGLGVPHATLTLAALPPGPGVQARARRGRYQAMGRWCRAHGFATLLTAHHADDQAETLLLRLRRGAGLAGLAAIRRQGSLAGVHVVRPLLGWTRAELAAVLPAGTEVADDPSNRSPAYDRTAARALLARESFLPARQLAASAAHLAAADEVLAWATERAAASRIRTLGDAGAALLVDPEGLPAELQRRLLAVALGRFAASGGADGGQVARLADQLRAGQTATLAGVRARPVAGGWMLTPAPPHAAERDQPRAAETKFTGSGRPRRGKSG